MNFTTGQSLSAADRRRRDSVATHDRYPNSGTATGRTGRRVVDSLGQPCVRRRLSRLLGVPSHGTPWTTDAGLFSWLVDVERLDERIGLVLAQDRCEGLPDIAPLPVLRLVVGVIVDGFAQLAIFWSRWDWLVRAGGRQV